MNISILQDESLKPEEQNFFVANALRFVIENVFANLANAYVITLTSARGPVNYRLQDILTKVCATLSFMALQVIVVNDKNQISILPETRYCNIIMTDSLESLVKTNIADYNRNTDGLEYYFIFLRTTGRRKRKEMERILRYCFDNFWLHCNIMIQNAKGEVLIYTYFPFREKNCFQTQPKLINKFLGKRFQNEIVFPDKLRNFNKCSLKLTTWLVPPFVMNRTNHFFPETKVGGFEVIILLAISRRMNFSLDIDLVSIDTYHQNKTPETVPINMLKNFETNITMGYFRRTVKRDLVATSTYVTYYLPLVAVILRKQSRYESLGIFTFPFDNVTWGLMILLYCVIILLNNLNAGRIKVNNFHVYEIFIGMSVHKVPKASTRRITFMTALLSSFFIRSVYQSLLFFLFRTHFYKAPPSSLQGLVTDGYQVVCTEMSFKFIANIPQIQDKSLPVNVIYSPNEIHPLYYLELHRNQNYAAISIIDFAVYYANEVLTTDEMLQILRINVNDQQIGFYLAKHSYLVERFNSYILWFQQAGLLLKWKEWSSFEYQVTKTRGSFTSYETMLMVNLNQLTGFFFVMMFLYFTAFLLFMLELLSQKIKFLQIFF